MTRAANPNPGARPEGSIALEPPRRVTRVTRRGLLGTLDPRAFDSSPRHRALRRAVARRREANPRGFRNDLREPELQRGRAER